MNAEIMNAEIMKGSLTGSLVKVERIIGDEVVVRLSNGETRTYEASELKIQDHVEQVDAWEKERLEAVKYQDGYPVEDLKPKLNIRF